MVVCKRLQATLIDSSRDRSWTVRLRHTQARRRRLRFRGDNPGMQQVEVMTAAGAQFFQPQNPVLKWLRHPAVSWGGARGGERRGTDRTPKNYQHNLKKVLASPCRWRPW